MGVRLNSVPDTFKRTGLNMPGTVVDFSVRGQGSADNAPDTTPEYHIERPITKRSQRLKDDRENLKDRLHRYIKLRSIQKWNPQNNLTTFCLMIDLNHSQHGHARRSCLHQSLWPKLASILRYVRTLFYTTFNTNTTSIVIFLLLSQLFVTGAW